MENLIDIIICLTAAMLLGGIIGIEREYRSKEAGFRTHFLVSLGSDSSAKYRNTALTTASTTIHV